MPSPFGNLASILALSAALFATAPAHAVNPLDAVLAFCHRALARKSPKRAAPLKPEAPPSLSPYELAKQDTRDLKASTHTTYTIGEVPPDAQLKAFLRNPENWMPERRALHEKMIAEQTAQVRAMSEVLKSSPLALAEPGTPLLVLTRGNSGSGKTYTIKTTKHPFFAELQLKAAMEKAGGGIINPDPLKTRIQKEWENGDVSVQQVHEEGSTIADKLVDGAFERGDSFVIDKRFPTVASVEAVAKRARAKGYRVVMIDLDAPLEDSSRRVLNRPVGGDDPNVPFHPIEAGFYEVREHRDAVAQSAFIDDYFAFTSDSSKPITGDPLAWRTKGLTLKIEQPALWDQVTKKGATEENAKRLYSELLDAMSTTLPNEFLLPLRDGAAFDSVDPLTFQAVEPAYRSMFDPPRSPKAGHLYLLALRDFVYEVRKGGGDRDHQQLGYYVEQYLKAVWPDIKVEKTFTPGTPTRNPAIRIKITHPDRKVLRQLLSDRKWSVRVSPDPKEKDTVYIDTREVGMSDWEKMVEPEREDGIGFNVNESQSPGSVGHEYLKTAHQMDFLADVKGDRGTRRIPKAPMLFEVVLTGIHARFHRDVETARFRYGFTLDEPHAYTYSAKVDVLQAEKALASGDKGRAKALAEAALKDWRVGSEMIALTMMGLEQPASRLDLRPGDRPRESWQVVPMDQSIASSFDKLRFHFHSAQANHRLGGMNEDKIRAELAKAKTWLTDLQTENDAVRKRAEELLQKLER